MSKQFILEQSTNTHKLSADKVVAKEVDGELGGVVLKVEGEGVVTHGEHKTLKTECPDVIKINQQEINPLTKKMGAAFD